MAVQEFFVNIDLKENQIKNVLVEVAASEPTTGGKAGQVKTYNGNFYISDGTNFHMLSREATVTAIDTRVTSLETTVKGADGSSGLVKDVADIKALIGMTGSEPGKSLADRVGALETAVGDDEDAPAADGSLYARVKKNVADISANSTAIDKNKTAIEKAQADATAANTKAAANEGAITDLQGRMDTAEGNITGLKNSVGTSSDAADASGTLYGRVKQNVTDISALKTRVKTAEDDIDALETGKVDKVVGKQLSTEDYTTAEKTKLGGIAEGAQVNVIETVKVDGSPLAVESKAVNIDLSAYAKKADLSSAYVYKGSVDDTSGLPSGASTGDVYNINNQFTFNGKVYPAGTNVAWNGTAWDPLGGTVDLSVYYTKTETDGLLGGKQANLTEAQLAAANSGITAAKVTTYDGYDAKITAAKSAADAAQATADKAVVANSAITAGTKCKITYDAKGLVTAGADLSVSDLPDAIPFSKTTGVLPYAQSPIMAASFDVSAATADTPVNISTGMTTALVAQVFDTNNKVVGCEMSITGGTVALTFSQAFTGTVHVIGLR